MLSAASNTIGTMQGAPPSPRASTGGVDVKAGEVKQTLRRKVTAGNLSPSPSGYYTSSTACISSLPVTEDS